jgi:hypothetical protein
MQLEEAGAYVFQNDIWRNISKKDGLPCSYVRKVLIEIENSIWFATGAGICRLQGVRFPGI